MSMKHYLAARKEGLKQQHAAQARGQDPYLPVLSELVPTLNKLTQVPLGLVQIALDQIEGTATKGRTTAFSRGFMPLLEPDSEFASKWSVLYDGIVEDGLRQPIVALEYYNRFYIVEGNKRVSVMRRLDAVSIEADVTRVLPEPEDSERYRVYQEFLSFYADTKINFITFTREGSYEKLYKLMGKTPGKKWSPEDLFDFQSCFYRFQQAYSAKAEGSAPMPACDALLIYLEVFGYEDSVEKTPAEFGQEIERIWSEFVVAAANKPAALLSQPTEAKPGFLQSVWHKPPQTVRCAFLYNRSPQDSGWSYWHELGRKALEDTFGSRVETVCRECVAQEDAQEVIERFIEDGYDVIFAASPSFWTPVSVSVPSTRTPKSSTARCWPATTMSAATTCACTRPNLSWARLPPPCRKATKSATSRITPSTARPRRSMPSPSARRWSTRAPKSCWNGPPCPATARRRRWPRAACTSSPAATSARRIWNRARSACITSRTA